ncbi:MAG: response regulator transcription factor, partial [Cyclobacteriaceae bacterium]
DDSVFNSLLAGATGYLVKDTPPSELLDSIKEVYEGGSPMSTHIARRIVTSFKVSTHSPLTGRETEILQKLCDGQNYKIIAEALFVSGHTVRAHIKNIYEKLHVHSRAEAVKKALKDRLI